MPSRAESFSISPHDASPYAPFDEGARAALVQRFADCFRLSRRELEVLDLCASGLSTKEISARLGCSQQTVAVYWSRIYRKVGCRSHVEVLARLLASALAGDRQQR